MSAATWTSDSEINRDESGGRRSRFTTPVIGAAPREMRDARPPEDSKHQHLEIILKTYNDFLTAEYANQLLALGNLGAEAEFVVQDYGTPTGAGGTLTQNSNFASIERRVELRVTMAGSWYALRWSRDSEALDDFDLVRAASMAKRFVEDIDSLLPLLKERLRYIKVAGCDVLQPIYRMVPTTVYRGSDDIWDIQPHRFVSSRSAMTNVLNAVTQEQPGISYVAKLHQLYYGSRMTHTMNAIYKTVMHESLVRTHIDHIDRHIYDVQGGDGWQIVVSFDEEGIVFWPTYFGEGLPDHATYPVLLQDGQCIFTAELGGESIHSDWKQMGCTFEEFDAAQLLSDPVTAFRKFERTPQKPAGASVNTAEAAIA